MTISERYRDLSEEVRIYASIQKKKLGKEAEGPLKDALKALKKADTVLAELQESVGEIPRIRLEDELTPVLMNGHNYLDRSRLGFLEAEEEKIAAEVWELQQVIYRLLNDL